MRPISASSSTLGLVTLSVNRLQEQKIKSWVCGKSPLKLLVRTDVLIEAIKYAWHCGIVMVRILTVYVRIKSWQQWAGWANYYGNGTLITH